MRRGKPSGWSLALASGETAAIAVVQPGDQALPRRMVGRGHPSRAPWGLNGDDELGQTLSADRGHVITAYRVCSRTPSCAVRKEFKPAQARRARRPTPQARLRWSGNCPSQCADQPQWVAWLCIHCTCRCMLLAHDQATAQSAGGDASTLPLRAPRCRRQPKPRASHALPSNSRSPARILVLITAPQSIDGALSA